MLPRVTDGFDPEAEYLVTLRRAAADPAVVGVVVLGSRAAGPFVTERSDVDMLLILDGPDADPNRWQTPHGSPVEIWATTLELFRDHGLAGSPTAWNRPAFLRARVDLDRLDGEIGRLVERKRRLDPDEAFALADNSLDGAINSLYRALRSVENGRDLAARLDAVEAIEPMLAAAFALEGRVRPFNKWLRYELEAEPLERAEAAAVVTAAERLLDRATPSVIRSAYARLEAAARATGHDAIVDGWEPDLAWLRGDEPYRQGASPSPSRNA
jgi:hypothetical protein